MGFELHEYSILCVDDEQQNLVTLQYALEPKFKIMVARSGAEAIEVLARQSIAILVCDQRMPGMTGLELCERALQVQPDTQRMLLTAYSDIDVVIAAINQGRVSRFMLKPWRAEELAQAFEAALEVHHLTRVVRELESRLLADRPQRATLAASVEFVHEVANPLASLTMTIAMAREASARLAQAASTRGEVALSEDLASLSEFHVDMVAGIGQLNAMLRRLRSGAQPESIHGSCDLRIVIESVVRIVRRAISPRTQLVAHCDASVELALDASVIAEIMINLVMNASQAIDNSALDGRTIRLEGKRVGSQVRITITDDGPGIAKDLVSRLFENTFRARGDGTGLGLSIVQALVRRAGGAITVESEPGKGTRFEVALPADPGPRFLVGSRP